MVNNKLHPQIDVKSDDRKILIRLSYPIKAYVQVAKAKDLMPGNVPTKTPHQQAKISVIKGDLPSVIELLEGHKP